MSSNAETDIWIPAVRPSHQGALQSLRRRWRWVIICSLVGLIVGASLAGKTDLQYAAKAKLRLLGERSTPASIDSRYAGDDSAAIRAQYYVLRSPRILGEVVNRLDLEQRWNEGAEQASRQLAGMVEARRLLDANISEVKVTSGSPQLSADLANTIVDVYLTQANEPRMQQAQRTLTRLRQECTDQMTLLHDAEQQTQSLRQEVGVTAGDGQFSLASLGALRQTVVQAEAGLIEARIRAEMMSRGTDDVLMALQSTSASDRVSQDLATRMIVSETKLGELERRYGPGHPQVQAADVEYQQIRRAAESQAVRLSELAQSDRSAAELRATQARQRLADAAGTLVAAGGSYGQLLAAQHREETLRNLVRLLSDRAQQLEVEMTLAGPAGDVIELAVPPGVPELGTPLHVAMAAVGAGLVLGLGMAIFVDRFDGRIRGAEEVEWQLGVQLLGVLGTNRALLSDRRAGPTAEGYRMIRNSIDFTDHTLRSLCVTGTGSREGTSTTVANLAWTWAEHGARVLVIDANVSRPSMHRLMGLQNTAGLIDHFAEHRSLDELVQQTKVANVSLLTAGRRAAGSIGSVPALTPQGLSELLLWARSRSDVILFDAAPVLKCSDASIIARQADGTALVVRQQWSAARDIRRAVHLLSSGGEGLLGVVLCGASSSSWDPIPIEDPEAESIEPAVSRSMVSKQRKRTRRAA